MNYLINLASLDLVIRAKSIAGLHGEFERAEAIGAEFLVLHAGNYKSQSVEQGIQAFVQGLMEAVEGFRPQGLEKTVRETEDVLGLRHVKMIHANDSKTPLGSHVDRHENIGEGYIGKAGFRRILAHPKLRTKPFILETPVEDEGGDRRNLENLKKLCPKSSTTTTRSN